MLRVAVIYNEHDIYIEWTVERFAETLTKYVDKYGSVAEALRRIEVDIKLETRRA